MKNKKGQESLWWIIGVGAVLAIIMLWGFISLGTIEPAVIDELALADAISTGVIAGLTPLMDEPEQEAETEAESTTEPTNEEEILRIVSEEDRQEDYARELVLDELDDRTFKSFLRDIINAELEARNDTSRVESWRDIDDIRISDIDVDVSGDDADVDLELKVYFLLDGDDDPDDAEKTKFEVTLEVIDLDVDDDFEDAEVEDYDETNFEFIKFYGYPF